MINLEANLLQFLNKNCGGGQLLLGLSGGPDSMALFHLLLKIKWPFMAAHVDHGWRAESKEEAKILEAMCLQHGVPFFLHKLEKMGDKNIEDEARNQRLAFFHKIVKEKELIGVLLAHQADDQAETVLKRVFEGASLQKLKGLKSLTEVRDLKIFRPLLDVPKKTLISWLEEQNLSYFLDSTNEDTRFLRGKMRKNLFPTLKEEFGKEVATGLIRIGKNAAELELFLEDFIRPYRLRIQDIDGRREIDFSQEMPKSVFLWKAIIRDFFNSISLTFSESVLETLIYHLEKRNANVCIRIGKKNVKIHKNVLSVSHANDFK